MRPTTDQRNLSEDFLPVVQGLIGGDTNEARHQAMVLNRAVVQGIDPFLLMEICPREFERVCGTCNLTVAQGQDAIMRAHTQGPGALLHNGRGILPEMDIDALEGDFWSNHELREEALWLLMADCTSAQVEGEDHDILYRMRETVQASIAFHRLSENLNYPLDEVLPLIREMTEHLVLVDMGDKALPGIPVTNMDVGFYLLYKAGHKCCGVQSTKTGAPTFYGVNAGCGTLADYGVACDKLISPAFGLVFNKES